MTATVAVIGAGASGTLTAAHLARVATRREHRLDLLLVDPAPVGTGVAYSTRDPRHRLNVPAAKLSAWPDDPEHFLRWLRRHVACDFPEAGYAPRLHYAEYLAGVLDSAAPAGGRVHVDHLRLRASDLRPMGRRLRLSLDDGTSRPVDAVVLALGHGRPSASWAPPTLLRAPQFVSDPWQPADEPIVHAGDEVLLVGAGLTAVDMAMRWGRDGVRVHMTSRHGMVPLPHDTDACEPFAAPTERPDSLAGVRRLVFDAIRDAGGDWRRAVDGLRPITAMLWRGLGDDERRRFLATAARRWDRARHRVDPAVHAWLEQRRMEGSVVVHAAAVTDAEALDGLVRVRLSDGATIDAAAVVNCTGTGTGVASSDDPLLLNLVTQRFAQPDPLDIGFATDDDGRLLSADGQRPMVWTLGPLRRGQLWESTAIPEIRAQAADLARQVVAALPSPQVRRRPRDPYGLPLSANEAAAQPYVRGLQRILRVQSGAEGLLAEAVRRDPGFALGHAALALLGAEWDVAVDVEAALAAAQSSVARSDERERRFVEVATMRVAEPGAASAPALLSYIQAYPEDALAVSLAVPTIAFGGATEIPAEAWALVEGLAPAYGDDWWYLGLLSFVRQEQNRFAEAGDLAVRALVDEPAAGHAVHAKAHVHYETGDHRAGLAWLDSWIASCGARASHRAHFAWHAAMHELALGDHAALSARYVTQLAPPSVTGLRALVDSASLLWRARLDGAEAIGDAAAIVRCVPPSLIHRPPTPFAALHAAMALAATSDCHGLAQLRRWAQSRGAGPFADTIAPLADGLCDLVHGDPERAAERLLVLRYVDRLGGSAAQREIVEDTLIHCAIAAELTDLADDILTSRLARRPSPRDSARQAQLHNGRLGVFT